MHHAVKSIEQQFVRPDRGALDEAIESDTGAGRCRARISNFALGVLSRDTIAIQILSKSPENQCFLCLMTCHRNVGEL